MSTSLQAIDADGNVVAVGSAVRIPQIPVWLIHDLPPEDVERIRSVEGQVLRVSEIAAHGYMWVAASGGGSWFCVKPSELAVVRQAQ